MDDGCVAHLCLVCVWRVCVEERRVDDACAARRGGVRARRDECSVDCMVSLQSCIVTCCWLVFVVQIVRRWRAMLKRSVRLSGNQCRSGWLKGKLE